MVLAVASARVWAEKIGLENCAARELVFVYMGLYRHAPNTTSLAPHSTPKSAAKEKCPAQPGILRRAKNIQCNKTRKTCISCVYGAVSMKVMILRGAL